MVAERRVSAFWNDLRQHEVNRKRSERFFQREDDRVSISCLDGSEEPIGALVGRDERRVEKAPERIDDVGCRQLAAVVEVNAASKRRDVHVRLGIVEALGEVRHHSKLLVDGHQAVENELCDLLRHVVGSDPRIEVVGATGNGDNDDVGIDRRLAETAGRGEQ